MKTILLTKNYNKTIKIWKLAGILAVALFVILVGPTLVNAASSTPSIDIRAIPSQIDKGDSSLIIWNVSNADSCVASGGWSGRKSSSGTRNVRPTKTTQYVLVCFNDFGSNSNFAVVGVLEEEELEFSFRIAPQTINSGESVVLVWSTENARTCDASGDWSGRKSTSGTRVLKPTENETYVLSCSSNNELSTLSRTVKVRQAPKLPAFIPPSTVIQSSDSQDFSLACVVSTDRAFIGQRVTFAAGETGGINPINFIWGGAVSGSGKVQSVNFSSVGFKNAQVTATDAIGRTRSTSCSTNIVIGALSTAQIAPLIKDTPIPEFLSYRTIVVPQSFSLADSNTRDYLFASVFSPQSFGLLLWYTFLILLNITFLIAFVYSGRIVWKHYFTPISLNGKNGNGNENNYDFLSSPRL